MNSLYLVRIVTHQQVTLYIDDNDTVWSKDLAEDPYDDIHPFYFDDLEDSDAIENAKLYGGEVVEFKLVVEPAKRRGERNENSHNEHGS